VQQIVNIIRGLIGLIGIVLLGYAAVGVGGMAWSSFQAHLANNERIFGSSEERKRASYERYFASLCPEYAEASTWDRWTRLSYLDWCEDYLDRLPQSKD